MANLDQNFNLASKLTMEQEKEVTGALESIDGINHVTIKEDGSKLTVGYTPGIINIQSIKETIESHGLDVSRRRLIWRF